LRYAAGQQKHSTAKGQRRTRKGNVLGPYILAWLHRGESKGPRVESKVTSGLVFHLRRAGSGKKEKGKAGTRFNSGGRRQAAGRQERSCGGRDFRFCLLQGDVILEKAGDVDVRRPSIISLSPSGA